MLFDYTVIREGSRHSGTVDADSRQAALQQLRAQGYAILSLQPAPAGTKRGGRPEKARSAGALLAGLFISKTQTEIALQQLASLLRAGVPIITAFNAISRQASRALSRIFERVTLKVKQGNSLQRSLEEEAPFLGRVTLGLIGVGESNGTLDDMLAYAAELMEKSRKVRGQIVQAFAYPGFVVLVAVGVSYYMVAVVFPKIMTFIQKQGGRVELPAPTRILIAVSDFTTEWGLVLIIVPVIIVAGLVLLRRIPRYGRRIDQALLHIPLLGLAFREHCNTMWCRTLGALLGSGIDVVNALALVSQTMGNQYYVEQFRLMQGIIRQGRSLTYGITQTALHRLCPIAVTMVAVSEETGGLSDSLLFVANYSEERLTRRTALLGTMIEPAIFIIVGGIVGFVYFSFFLAMLAVTKSAR
jgi:type IV pilus assembly protein PilC